MTITEFLAELSMVQESERFEAMQSPRNPELLRIFEVDVGMPAARFTCRCPITWVIENLTGIEYPPMHAREKAVEHLGMDEQDARLIVSASDGGYDVDSVSIVSRWTFEETRRQIAEAMGVELK